MDGMSQDEWDSRVDAGEDPYALAMEGLLRSPLEPVTFGQGSFGTRCRLCNADTYDTGKLVHRQGCPAANFQPERMR